MADNGSYYKFTTSQCVVRVYKNPIRFAMYDKNNRAVIYEEAEPLAFGLKKRPKRCAVAVMRISTVAVCNKVISHTLGRKRISR